MCHSVWARKLVEKHGEEKAYEITTKLVWKPDLPQREFFESALAWLKKHYPVTEEKP